jgi:hypothetical protein
MPSVYGRLPKLLLFGTTDLRGEELDVPAAGTDHGVDEHPRTEVRLHEAEEDGVELVCLLLAASGAGTERAEVAEAVLELPMIEAHGAAIFPHRRLR